MKDSIKNIAASVLARLKSQSEKNDRPFVEILQYYAMERFLYRLSQTKYANKFILKGGLLFYAWDLPLRRATRDIDFRGYVSNNRADLYKIIIEIIEESVDEDGIIFNTQSILIEETQIDSDYHGIRVKILAFIERTKIPIQIDIGFLDEIGKHIETVYYPNLLSSNTQVKLKSYSKEFVIAEKFHAMVQHAELNSRMKDYYDLWLLAESFEFESRLIQIAIETTFRKRLTQIPYEKPLSFSKEFAQSSQSRWAKFLNKMKLENNEITDFDYVIKMVWTFLEYPLLAINKKTESHFIWMPKKAGSNSISFCISDKIYTSLT